MRSPRYVLFRPTSADISAAHVFLALALIPNTGVLPTPDGHLVFDRNSERCVRVALAAGPLIATDARALAAEHPAHDPDGSSRIAATTARFELHYPEDDAAVGMVLLVQGALERLTDGFGYDLERREITIARGVGVARIERAKAEGSRAHEASRCSDELATGLEDQRGVYEELQCALARRELPVAREPRRSLVAKVAAARKVPALGRAVARLLRERSLPAWRNAELQALVDEIEKKNKERGN